MVEKTNSVENWKLVIVALVSVFGGNTGTIVDSYTEKDHRPDPFTGLDGAKLEKDMVKMLTSHYREQQRDMEDIRLRISQLEFMLTPKASVVFKKQSIVFIGEE